RGLMVRASDGSARRRHPGGGGGCGGPSAGRAARRRPWSASRLPGPAAPSRGLAWYSSALTDQPVPRLPAQVPREIDHRLHLRPQVAADRVDGQLRRLGGLVRLVTFERPRLGPPAPVASLVAPLPAPRAAP